jgi:hypothetical protein
MLSIALSNSSALDASQVVGMITDTLYFLTAQYEHNTPHLSAKFSQKPINRLL